MNVLSLFDGISCGQIALGRTGIKYNNYYASEINEESISVTQLNYPNTIQLGDVTKLDKKVVSELPKIDLLIGGSPCQGISRAKSGRLNLDDPRSKLFFEYVRIRDWLIKYNNPDLLYLLENVKPNKETIGIMNETMGIEPVRINSSLVSAQNRDRLYWTNIEGIEQPKDKRLLIKDIIYEHTYQIREIKPEHRYSIKHTPNYIKWDTSGKGYYSQQNRAYFMDGKMCTVPKSRPNDKLNIWLGDNKFRKIHPIEAERLQTLPDNYTSTIKSIDKRIGLVGDGWTVDVISHIFSYIDLNKINQDDKKELLVTV